jgi:chromate transport protein ChrA
MTAAIDSPKEEKKTDAAEDSLADEIPVATVLDVEAAGGKNVEENVKEIEGTNGTEVLPNKGKMHAFLSTFGFMAEREGHNAPQLPLYEIFAIFFWFGCRAFGGPVAQIAMMKQEIVVEKKWISTELFNRVYAVYQVLPGPEATELACYFGFLSGGRLGAIMGGLGFVIPGVLLLFFWSYIYVTYGTGSPIVQASFHALRVTVAALIFKGVHKLSEHTLEDPKTKSLSWDKGVLCMFNFLVSHH